MKLKQVRNAKRWLSNMEVDRCKFRGIPLEQFSQRELVKITGITMCLLDKSHQTSMEIASL